MMRALVLLPRREAARKAAAAIDARMRLTSGTRCHWPAPRAGQTICRLHTAFENSFPAALPK
jgi:hypothetical protein